MEIKDIIEESLILESRVDVEIIIIVVKVKGEEHSSHSTCQDTCTT